MSCMRMLDYKIFWPILVALIVMLTSCQSIERGIFSGGEFNEIKGVDLSAKGGGSAGSSFGANGRSGGPAAAQFFYGAEGGSPITNAPAGISPSGGDQYSLNFSDAPIQSVAQAIIGDILKQPFAIDPRVQGTLTLSSGRPIAASAVLPVLETALRMNNAVIVRDPSLYRIIPASDAAGAGDTQWVRGRDQPSAGYGISVLPLQYASSQSVMRLVEGFGARPGSIRVDPANNLLLIAGTAQERQSAISTAKAFDVDWMRNQSAGLFPVTNASPQAIIRELATVLGGNGRAGLPADIRLQPIDRMNAVLAVARRPQTINEIGKWVARLDRADYGSARIHIYHVKFGRAAGLAAILNNSFGQNGSGGGAVDQLAPGATASRAQSPAGQPGFSMNDGQSNANQNGGGSDPGGNTSSGGQGRAGGSADGGTEATFSSDGSGDAGFGALVDGGDSSDSGDTSASAYDNIRITPDPSSNSIVIFANAEQYRIIERALIDLDRQPEQVAIEATIAEVTLNDKLKYGVQYFLRANINGTTINMAQFGATTALTQVAPAFNLIVGSETGSRVIIDLLNTVTRVKIVSSPSLVVVNNETAALQVGDQVPVTTRSSQSTDTTDAPTVNEIEFKNTGVILNVRPRISANNMVSIDVEQEISAVVNNSNADTLTPTISQRRVRSQISVPSGQTVLLAGLISDRQEGTKSGIPGLMNVPIIGSLVSNTGLVRTRTELIVFIKPQIIRDAQDAATIAQRMRDRVFNVNDDN